MRPQRGKISTTIDTSRLNRILRDLPGNRAHALETIAREINTAAVVSMGEEKHGRMYDVGGVAEHQASAPGEAPAIDTGYLANSMTAELLNSETAIVYTNAEYAEELEFGGSHLAPRPFLQPAVSRVTAAIERDPAAYFAGVVGG